MKTLSKHLSAPLFLILILILFMFFTSICIIKNPSVDSRFGLASKSHLGCDLCFQDIAYRGEKETMWPRTTTTLRRRLTGPGSSPPRCARKCGRCTPCKPIHVAVPPGTPVTAEYYPEAWRCKCGNRLYMP